MSETALPRSDLYEPAPTAELRGNRVLSGFRAALARLRARWAADWQFHRELEIAAGLDDRMLMDMGLTRHDIRASRRAGRWVRDSDTF